MSEEWPEDDREKREPHPADYCVVKPGDMFFHGKMSAHCGQWVPRYTCQTCGRQMRMPSNYLGKGKLICTGNKFWKPWQQNIRVLGHANMRALIAREEGTRK